MQYLFFDIECCDGHHMCSFGYVIIDDCFKIIKKEDILINPQYRFKEGRAGFDPRTQLAYSVDTFKKQKPFFYSYERIKKILTASNQILLGHSITSDIQFIKSACKRYNLPQIELEAFDTQIIFSKYKHDERSYSLINIINDLNIDVSHLKEHKSSDDAEMSMLVIKEICSRSNIPISELLLLYKSCKKTPKRKIHSEGAVYNVIQKALKKKGISLDKYMESLKK